MKIKWTEDRRLPDNRLVRAGEEADYPDAEARAYINNGVAVALNASLQKEVTDNG